MNQQSRYSDQDPIVRLPFLLLGAALCFTGCATPYVARGPPKSETPMNLVEATTSLAGTSATRLHPNYIWATLKARDQDAAISAAFEQALAQGTRESRLSLLRALELKFIHDPKISGLDILGPELSHYFRDFDWQADDFPGGPKGPNEQFADVMVDVLDLVRPERRANHSRRSRIIVAQSYAG